MNHDSHAKTAFSRECGSDVMFERVVESNRGVDFTFRIVSRGTTHTIGTNPAGTGRNQIESAAAQAGRWAKVMAERAQAAHAA
jgi:hypothetical protein